MCTYKNLYDYTVDEIDPTRGNLAHNTSAIIVEVLQHDVTRFQSFTKFLHSCS